MKKIISLSICLGLLFTACNNASNTNSENSQKVQPGLYDTTKLAAGTTFYQCPMDLQVLSDKPGSCSVCGMDLEKVEKK